MYLQLQETLDTNSSSLRVSGRRILHSTL